MSSTKPLEILVVQPAGLAANEEFIPNATASIETARGWSPYEVWRTRVLPKQRQIVSTSSVTAAEKVPELSG